MATYIKTLKDKNEVDVYYPRTVASAITMDDGNTSLESAMAAKAPVNSPAFGGNPTAPTQADGTNNTTIATTAFVRKTVQQSAYTIDTANHELILNLASGVQDHTIVLA